jgi:glycosyltransferase involved in cell wall biosynthesis
MTNVISVITAVHTPAVRYLPDAFASLERQTLPSGWEWQWVIQEDGETGNASDAVPTDARISLGSGRPGGPGVARTLGLSRVEGSLVKVLDADDVLTPGALARDIDVLANHPHIGWTTAKGLDLLPDGTTVSWDQDDPPEGPLSGAFVFDFWREHDYRLPVLPATLCIRRELALALGGWMALPASEDTGLLLAASVVSAGYFISQTGILYRKWPGQSTAGAAHTDTVERPARMAVIEQRVRALRGLLDGQAVR